MIANETAGADNENVLHLSSISQRACGAPVTPGRWQTYHSLPAPADSDGDGIPDYWEEQFGLSKNSATQDSDGDGYTNIEEYLNNTNPNK